VYALSDVIDFVLSLLRDDSKLAAFEEDPEGALDAAGLQGLTGQDVRDAQLVMADNGSARPNSDGGSSGGGGGGGGDAVSQITHVTRHYHAAPETTIVQIDDRDTTINDSFNSDDDFTVINDSFNSSVENDVTAIQDNDTVINDVTAIQDNDTVIQDNDTVIEGGPEPEPLRSEGISTEDIVGPEPEPEPEPVFETEVEPVAEAEPEPEPEPEPEADVEPDVDAAVV
jgi:hypothetical protein